MPAYMIALNRTVHDRQKLEAYWKAAAPTFEGRGAKFLSVYTPLAPLELMGSLEGVVLIEFPDVAAAKAWYESPAYQQAKQHRDGAADTEFFIIDGGLVPLEDRCRTSKTGGLSLPEDNEDLVPDRPSWREFLRSAETVCLVIFERVRYFR
jgi:uncharacterized protein (DUF1330 family)